MTVMKTAFFIIPVPLSYILDILAHENSTTLWFKHFQSEMFFEWNVLLQKMVRMMHVLYHTAISFENSDFSVHHHSWSLYLCISNCVSQIGAL